MLFFAKNMCKNIKIQNLRQIIKMENVSYKDGFVGAYALLQNVVV
jgi:hypothetical protein